MYYENLASSDIVNLFKGYIRFYLQRKAATFFTKRNLYFERNILVADMEELLGSYELVVTVKRKKDSISELENFLDNERLSQAVKPLNLKEKALLFYKFFDDLSDLEISEKIGVSRQYISKMRTSTLNKIKKFLLS